MKIKLPKVAESLVKASNEQNVNSYLNCFTENTSIDDVGDKAKVTGTFEGSPVNFKLEMGLRSGLIHHLKMNPAQ